MTILLGAHIGSGLDKVNARAEELGATAVQIFVGSPMTWNLQKAPVTSASVKKKWDIPVYIHAAYLANPASSDPTIRAKTAAYLRKQLAITADLGAAGLVIHGGHNAGGSVSEGIAGWVEVLDQVELTAPLLIENTAGGNAAPAKTLENWKKLWAAVGGRDNLGVCIDSAHAYAAGMPLEGLAEEILNITGRIDLIHGNGTLSGFGSGRDKHSSLYNSLFPAEAIADLGKATGAPIILETPSGLEGQITELNMLRKELGMKIPKILPKAA
jgi:deoxyribonuclease-4